MKVFLVTKLGWSLYDIDRTDAVSLFRFFGALTRADGAKGGAEAPTRRIYADEADWL